MRLAEISRTNKASMIVALTGITLGAGVSTLFHASNPKTAVSAFVLPVLLGMIFFTLPRVKSFALNLRWWHILWLILFVSGLTFRIRGVEQIYENVLDPAALFKIGLVSVVGITALVKGFSNQKDKFLRVVFGGLVGLLTLYAVFGIISTVWSVYPAWTLYKSAEYLVDIALIATILTCVRSAKEYKSLFDFTWVLLAALMGTVWLGMILWPDEAIRRGVGLTGIQICGVLPVVSANGTGDLGAILGIVAIGRLVFRKQKRKLYLTLLLISVATLILSYSRTPLTCFFLAVLVMFYAGRRLTLLTGILIAFCIAPLTPLGQFFWEFFLRGQSSDLFMSLSGRIYWWEYLWELFKESPILGLGAYAGGRFVVLTAFNADFASSIDNAFLEVAIGSGVAGLVPLLAALLGTWKYLLKSIRATKSSTLEHYLAIEALGLLTIETFRAFFTSGRLIWHPAVCFLLVLGYAELLRRKLKIIRNEKPLE